MIFNCLYDTKKVIKNCFFGINKQLNCLKKYFIPKGKKNRGKQYYTEMSVPELL